MSNEFEQPIIDSSHRDDLLIWWTSQDECEKLYGQFPSDAPEYIRNEFQSRYGRNGRGRLWSDDQFGDVGIPWDITKPAARLASERGGIVVNKADAAWVFGLWGFLTDLRLNFINEIEPSP